MNEAQLSKRLQAVADYVPQNSRLADIGSDHAYLPVWLYLNNKIDFGIAGEVVEGPYQSAKRLIEKQQLTEVISVRLGNGLDVIDPENDVINVITIAGMGGALIRDILEQGKKEGKLTGQERLVLQPNIAEQLLRTWLLNNEYEMIAEKLVKEDGKYYEVIVAQKNTERPMLTDKELLFGPYLLQQKGNDFNEKWQSEYKKREYILNELKKATRSQTTKIKKLEQELSWIREEIDRR